MSNSKMSAGARRQSRSRSRSQSRAGIVSLDTLDTARLIEKINISAGRLFQYAIGEERMESNEVGQHFRDVVARGLEIIKERNDSIEDESAEEVRKLLDENTELGEDIQKLLDENGELGRENVRLKAILDDVYAEMDDMGTELENIVDEKDTVFREYQDGIRDILEEYWQLEEGDNLAYELERNMDWNRRELAQKNDLIDYINDQLNACRQERDNNLAYYKGEQILTRILTRRIILLKMTNRQLQIRLMNAPAIAPAPPPQPIDQIWLLLQ